MGELINGRTIEEIKNNLEQCSKVSGCAGCEHLGDLGCVEWNMRSALALIKHLEAKQPKWISVKERLPEYKTAVLGYGLRESVHGNIDPFPAEHIVYTKGEGEGWFTFWNKEYVKVTHWMPLPQPPEEDAE